MIKIHCISRPWLNSRHQSCMLNKKEKKLNNLNYRLQHQKNITRYIISNVSSTFDAELFSSTFDVKLIWNCAKVAKATVYFISFLSWCVCMWFDSFWLHCTYRLDCNHETMCNLYIVLHFNSIEITTVSNAHSFIVSFSILFGAFFLLSAVWNCIFLWSTTETRWVWICIFHFIFALVFRPFNVNTLHSIHFNCVWFHRERTNERTSVRARSWYLFNISVKTLSHRSIAMRVKWLHGALALHTHGTPVF